MSRTLSRPGAGLLALVLVGFAAAGRAAPLEWPAMRDRLEVRHDKVARKVLAFYYPWYGKPDVPGGSGRAFHWGKIDAAAHDIAASTHYPAAGAYDSHDPATIRRHCREAKQAGIDGLIVSWWGPKDFTDKPIRQILDACQAEGLQATIYYEVVPSADDLQTAVNDFLYLLRQYGQHPAWLKADGRPVLFVYGRAVGQVGLRGWLSIMAEVCRRSDPQPLFLGDQFSRPAACVFDGLHTYNTAGQLKGKGVAEVRDWARKAYPAWVETADALGRISTLTVIPGYDDTKIRKPGLAVERFGGQSYQAQWEAAIAADPHWVLITSFNEWHEGSEIEPSREDGERYLKLTAGYAERFKALGARKPRAAAAGLTAAQLARLKRLAGATIGLLPEGDGPAFWWLARTPLKPELLTWQRVAAFQPEDARRLPVLLYAAAEKYRQSVARPGDVDEGLLRYLQGGGFLVVLPSEPMPFHYNEKKEPVASSRKLGLPLSVGGSGGGWERPPEGASLEFVQQDGRLPSLPQRLAFPGQGDRRWRPLVRSALDKQAEYTPLLELRDRQGHTYGDAAGLIRLSASGGPSGRILYVWYGLTAGPHADALLADVFGLVAEQLPQP